jgi:hypothetical protein
LAFEHRFTGYGDLETSVRALRLPATAITTQAMAASTGT